MIWIVATIAFVLVDNDEERPFSRDQRRWIYASAKRENNYFGFGSDNEMELQPHYLIIKHSTVPLPAYHIGDAQFDPQFRIPCAKVTGGARGGRRAFRPPRNPVAVRLRGSPPTDERLSAS